MLPLIYNTDLSVHFVHLPRFWNSAEISNTCRLLCCSLVKYLPPPLESEVYETRGRPGKSPPRQWTGCGSTSMTAAPGRSLPLFCGCEYKIYINNSVSTIYLLPSLPLSLNDCAPLPGFAHSVEPNSFPSLCGARRPEVHGSGGRSIRPITLPCHLWLGLA